MGVKSCGVVNDLSTLLFKGQSLDARFTTRFYCFEIDMLGFKADDILEVNR